MLIARVIGTVVATRKDPELEGVKLLLIRACDLDGRAEGPALVAVDAVGSGVGEVVLYAAGSSARLTAITQNRPVDAVVMAIVDQVEAEGRGRYTKDAKEP